MSKQIIAPAHQRFNKQLDVLSTHLIASRKADHASLSLYKSGARTPLFMLESLARIHRSIHNKKLFSKLYDDFKKPEDLLGAIDQYDVLHREYSKNKNVHKEVITYFAEGRNNSVKSMSKMLKKEKWTSKKQKKIIKISDKLQNADWLTTDEESPAIANFLIQEIEFIKNNLETGKLSFRDIETGVHELRRKLRWISIYPASLNGLIQLAPQNKIPASLKKYVTTKIVNSPFNAFPGLKRGWKPIKINANDFYALSWMIAELGDIKDKGLKIHAITEALEYKGILEGDRAIKKAMEISGQKGVTVRDLLSQAESITHDFVFKHHVLDKLQNDIAKYV